jgi:hypothetical protein
LTTAYMDPVHPLNERTQQVTKRILSFCLTTHVTDTDFCLSVLVLNVTVHHHIHKIPPVDTLIRFIPVYICALSEHHAMKEYWGVEV